jgi:hypothetical protein
MIDFIDLQVAKIHTPNPSRGFNLLLSITLIIQIYLFALSVPLRGIEDQRS